MNDVNSRYGLNPAHSEVIEAMEHVSACDALDMGCSNGRNALFLSQHGFNVTAVDHNPGAIDSLQSIIEAEGIDNIHPKIYDLNEAAISDDYGFIACTVTLMFLNPERVPAILANMQERTLPGGYNLIVCAMSTEAYPCPVGFPFVLDEGELRDTYAGWEMVKYNEDLGTMHNGMQFNLPPCSRANLNKLQV
ncbi:tellurite resistance methyltransferase TehB [Suttonella sp. R2A3]|uniref:tellurite resistance methyltransferase TehB n=1 Tax=Suttonella sp. R2A3 TaxID=2908648 RepID=UPI001F3109DD|nr:tellurite resistance methyltransferase TehB [Suttonella sp. R2A3]UJF25272.1 tellurite resistance methyltransferase TehB [Suttonella sp. R2A3]